MQPTKAQTSKLIQLLSSYILTDGAHIRVQQAAYDKYMGYLERLEASYPEVDFRGEATQAELQRRAIAKSRTKVFRGPGSSF